MKGADQYPEGGTRGLQGFQTLGLGAWRLWRFGRLDGTGGFGAGGPVSGRQVPCNGSNPPCTTGARHLARRRPGPKRGFSNSAGVVGGRWRGRDLPGPEFWRGDRLPCFGPGPPPHSLKGQQVQWVVANVGVDWGRLRLRPAQRIPESQRPMPGVMRAEFVGLSSPQRPRTSREAKVIKSPARACGDQMDLN